MRLLADHLILDSTSLGSPGIDEVKWVRPVKPGDILASRMTILEARPSRSRPSLGLVRFRFELVNQADEIVMTQTNSIMFGRKDSGPVRGEGPAPDAAAPRPAPEAPPVRANPYLDDLVV